jgi:hypothetical protein
MHICQILLHAFGREHIDVLETHWLEDVFLEVVIQPQPADALDKHPSPVDVDAVFPLFARLVDERLAEVFRGQAREFVQANLCVEVTETCVKHRVSEAGCEEGYERWAVKAVDFRMWDVPVCERSIRNVIFLFFGTSLPPSMTWTFASSCGTQVSFILPLATRRRFAACYSITREQSVGNRNMDDVFIADLPQDHLRAQSSRPNRHRPGQAFLAQPTACKQSQ